MKTLKQILSISALALALMPSIATADETLNGRRGNNPNAVALTEAQEGASCRPGQIAGRQGSPIRCSCRNRDWSGLQFGTADNQVFKWVCAF